LKLIVTVGLPRSGKTTWARTSGWPIVNPDSIRLAIHGQRFYGPAEPLVWATAYLMVEALRLAGHRRIVVDATNVSAKRRTEWESRYPGAVEWKVIETSPEECIARARAEGDEAIVPVIERMAKEWDWRCASGSVTKPGHERCTACEEWPRGAPSSPTGGTP
jgi:predicted kinase